MGKVITIAKKDILFELRTKRLLPGVLVFALLAIVIFNFAFAASLETIRLLTPGILWVTFAFAGILGLNRSFALEMEDGCLEGLMACPVSREVIYLGKVLGNLIFMLSIEVPALLAFGFLFNVAVFSLQLLAIVFLATLGFVAVGTLFSALAANTRARELVLPVLFLPLVIPVMISAVKASGLALSGESWSSLASWLEIIAAFDVIFLVTSVLVFNFVIEE